MARKCLKNKYSYKKAKKMNQKLQKKLKPNIKEKTISSTWKEKASTVSNYDRMGLVYNLKKLPIRTTPINSEQTESTSHTEEKPLTETQKMLIAKSKNVKKGIHRIPPGMAKILTSFLNTYGEDYHAMARDPRNRLEQYTWKQWRNKVKEFKNSPDQYAKFLKKRKEKGPFRLSDVVLPPSDDEV